MTLRIVFMGTPDFSVPTLEALHNAGHEIVACYTQPPRPAGRRGLDLVPSPVQQAAEKLEIPVYHPTSLKGDDEQKIFQSHSPDVAVVVAYGLLLPKPVLNAPKQGCYNGHASLLPRWRGAAPLQRAIMAGDAETGMMIMKMEEGLDTGPIALQSSVPITELTTAASLHDQLSEVGADLMVQAMDRLAAGDLPLSAQSGDGILYASKIQKAESRINWDQSCEVVHRHVMGLSPFPGAWCEMPIAGKVVRVKVLESKVQLSASAAPGTLLNGSLTIACKTGGIELVRLQKAGSKATTAEEFLRGNQLVSGEVLE